jgi:hypothetical protein
MATQYNRITRVSGFNQPLQQVAPLVIYAFRDPTANDFAQQAQIWQNQATAGAFKLWIFNGSNNGQAIWLLLGAGSAGDFSSLTVTPGPISLTGTTNINTAGAAVTNIGVGGTGAVNIGNTTGNTHVTGTITSSAGITATTGNTVATAGNISTTAGSISSHTTLTAGTGITATTGAITATAGAVIAGTILTSEGDAAGTASTNSLSNVVATAAGGGTVTFGANGAGNITQTGWMKMYAGVTAVYIPYFAAI